MDTHFPAFSMTMVKRICNVDGCKGKYRAKGLCKKHYYKKYMNQYRKNHKEQVAKIEKRRYQKHKKQRNKLSKQYREENKSKVSEYMKRYGEKWREKNKVKRAIQQKQYQKENKEKIAKRMKKYRQTSSGKASRKADKFNRRTLTKDLTAETIQRVYSANIIKYKKLTCYLCFKPIIFKNDSIDHSTPLSRKGCNNYKNLGIAHLKCNLEKGTKTLEEWQNEKNYT